MLVNGWMPPQVPDLNVDESSLLMVSSHIREATSVVWK